MKYNLTQENKNVFETELKYRTSFVDEEGFEGKRFDRYIEKTKKYILEEYLKIVYPSFFDTTNHSTPIVNLTDFIVKLFQVYYFHEVDEKTEKQTLFSAIHKYAMPNLDIYTNDEILEKYLMNPYWSKKGGLSLETIINDEIRKVCKEFIKHKILEKDNIDLSNYFLTLPSTTKDAIFIFDSVLNYVKVDIENFIKSNTTSDFLKLTRDEILKTLDDENNNLNDTVKKLNDELSLKENNIKNLNSLISEKDTKKDDYEELLLEHISTLERQNIKIKEKYNKLLEKYENLKEKTIDTIEDEETFVTFKELDFNEKFLFVASEDISFQQNILNIFPNASFCNSNININSANVYMVIVLTSHIDHSTYYGIKEQCKNKSIPLIHCKFSNIELIKELIWNYINI